MEKSLKEIIKEVGKEYEMEDEIINEIIKKLQKEFYIKLKHMKNLSIETWKSLDLPINLYYVLNELYQSALSEQQTKNESKESIQPQQPPQIHKEPVLDPQHQNKISNNQGGIFSQYKAERQAQQNKNIIQKNIDDKSKFNNINKIDENYSLQNLVHNNLSILFAEIDNLDISRKVFKQIYTIISNIAHNPNDEKYRRFNINKFITIFKYKNIVPFFTSIGFRHVDDYMYLIGEAKEMSIVNTELNQFIKDNKIAETTFNPYKGSIASLGGNSEQMKKVAQNEVNFEDLYYQEIERRNVIIKKAKVERNPKIFELEKNYSINRIINTINQYEEDMTEFHFNDDNEDNDDLYSNISDIKKEEKEANIKIINNNKEKENNKNYIINKPLEMGKVQSTLKNYFNSNKGYKGTIQNSHKLLPVQPIIQLKNVNEQDYSDKNSNLGKTKNKSVINKESDNEFSGEEEKIKSIINQKNKNKSAKMKEIAKKDNTTTQSDLEEVKFSSKNLNNIKDSPEKSKKLNKILIQK